MSGEMKRPAWTVLAISAIAFLLVCVTAGWVIDSYLQPPRIVIPPAPRSAEPDRIAQADAPLFRQILAIQPGQIIRPVTWPSDAVRSDFYSKQFVAKSMPDFPGAMLIFWQNGTPRVRSMVSGQPGFKFQPGFDGDTLIRELLHVSSADFAGDPALAQVRTRGNFVMDDKADAASLCPALARIISQASGVPITLILRDVPRPVIFFSGDWNVHYLHPPLLPGRPRMIEIYGSKLNTDWGSGGGGAGDTKELA